MSCHQTYSGTCWSYQSTFLNLSSLWKSFQSRRIQLYNEHCGRMNWETFTKLNLTHHCQKSLPQLNEQIQKQLWDGRKELKECEGGPPQDPKGAKQFLTQVGSHIITSWWWLHQIFLPLWISVFKLNLHWVCSVISLFGEENSKREQIW